MSTNIPTSPKSVTRLQRCLDLIPSPAVQSLIETFHEKNPKVIEPRLEEDQLPDANQNPAFLEAHLLGIVHGYYEGYQTALLDTTAAALLDFRNELIGRLNVPEDDSLPRRMVEFADKLQALRDHTDTAHDRTTH